MKYYPYTRKRFFATLIDYVFVWGVTICYILYFGEADPDGGTSVHGLQTLPLFALWLLYIVAAERFGGTVGHRIFRLKVVTMDGGQPGLWRTFLRRYAQYLRIRF